MGFYEMRITIYVEKTGYYKFLPSKFHFLAFI